MDRLNVWIVFAAGISLVATSILAAEEPAGRYASSREIVVDLDVEVGEMYNFWNVYPVTVQAPFLDEQQ